MEKVAKKDAKKTSIYLPKTRGNLNEEKWLRLKRLRWVLDNQDAGLESEDFFVVLGYLQTKDSEQRSLVDSECYTLYAGMPLDAESVLEQQEQLVDVRGYWNIEPIGGGRIELKNRHLKHIEAATGDQVAWSGIILRAPDNDNHWIALQEKSVKFSEENLRQLTESHERLGWNPPPKKLEEDFFFNADRLPENSHLVVSGKELQRFISQLEEPANGDQNAPTDNDHQDYPPHLEALILAWRKNWKNADRHDRSTHPKKDTVKSWLLDKGLSDRTADAGATIITPDWKK